MITSFRKLMEGPGKYVFLTLIIAAFGVVGVPALSNFGKSKALEVGKIGYTAQEIDLEFSRRLRNRQQSSETAISREEAISEGLLAETINTLKLRALIREEADALGLSASDELVQDFLRNDPVFQDTETGEYDASLVTRYIQITDMSVDQFRREIEIDIYRQQLNGALRLAQPVSDIYAKTLVLRQNEERDTAIAVLTLDNLAALEEDELLAYYDTNSSNYQSPEYRRYALLNLSEEDVKDRVSVSEEEIQQLFDAREAYLGTPETRSFRQAQFSTMAEAEAALAAIEAGTEFEAAVTAAEGRIVSFENETESALADETVAEAIFAAETTGLVGPIDGLFGNVLADITMITPAVEVTLEDVREELETELGEEIYRAELDGIYDEIQEAGDQGMSLADAARDLGFEVTTIGPVSRTGETPDGSAIETMTDIQRKAFTMGQDGFFEDVSLPEGGYAFLQVEEILPAALIAYDTVATQVAIDAAADQRETALDGLVDDIRLTISKGTSFEDAVAEAGGTAVTRTLSTRMPPADLPATLVNGIFSDAAGDVLSELGGGGASVTLAQVKEIRFGANSQADILVESLKYQIGQELSADLYQAYIASLETEIGVKTDNVLLGQRFGAEQ